MVMMMMMMYARVCCGVLMIMPGSDTAPRPRAVSPAEISPSPWQFVHLTLQLAHDRCLFPNIGSPPSKRSPEAQDVQHLVWMSVHDAVLWKCWDVQQWYFTHPLTLCVRGAEESCDILADGGTWLCLVLREVTHYILTFARRSYFSETCVFF